MKIDFGKYGGQELETIPTGYLRWVLREVRDLSLWLRRSIEAELTARGHGAQSEPPQQQQNAGHGLAVMPMDNLRQRVRQWHSEMARTFHPDAGGHSERMVALNLAAERLRSLLGV